MQRLPVEPKRPFAKMSTERADEAMARQMQRDYNNKRGRMENRSGLGGGYGGGYDEDMVTDGPGMGSKDPLERQVDRDFYNLFEDDNRLADELD